MLILLRLLQIGDQRLMWWGSVSWTSLQITYHRIHLWSGLKTIKRLFILVLEVLYVSFLGTLGLYILFVFQSFFLLNRKDSRSYFSVAYFGILIKTKTSWTFFFFVFQPVEEPEKMTQIIVRALEITGQRGIINKGWGGLGNCIFY